jgi:[acyl-carrier-protein] S-malonyltransferase
MQPAAEPFALAVSTAGLRAPSMPFVSNKTAAAMTAAAEIADALVYQLTHPVRWVACVQYLAAEGVTSIVEFGPGRVLTGLIKRIAPDITLRNINGVASIEK